MSGEISTTRTELNALIPPECDCTEIKTLAHTYDKLVQDGVLTHEEAITGFEENVDPNCGGKVPREQVETGSSCFAGGCGVSEKVCRRSKYLIAMTMKVRQDTAT